MRAFLIATVLVLAGLGSTGVAEAANLVVDTTADDPTKTTCDNVGNNNNCSLRGAFIALRTIGAGTHTVTIPAGTYTLSHNPTLGSEDLAAEDDLDFDPDALAGAITISGADARTTIIDANGIDRVLDILGGTLNLTNVTIRGGITGSGGGGGIRVRGAAVVTATDVHVTGNQATTDTLGGGGIRVGEANTSFSMTRGAITGNASSGSGGGIFVSGPSIAVNNSAGFINVTISGNTAAQGGSGVGAQNRTSVSFTHATVTLNTNSSAGAGTAGLSYSGSGVGGLTTLSSIVAANRNSAGLSNCSGVSTGGNNVSDTTECPYSGGGDAEGVEVVLSPLQDVGGQTPGHLPIPGSVAIDTAGNPACDASTDQRGVTRAQDGDNTGGSQCDKGSIEVRLLLVDKTVDDDPALAAASNCTLADGSDCTLRGAIHNVNGAAVTRTGDIIHLPAGTYTLTRAGGNENANSTGDLDILADVGIQGAGAATTIIQAGTSTTNGVDRIINVRNPAHLHLSGVTLRFGKLTVGAGESGGALKVEPGASLTLTDALVSQNSNSIGAGGGLGVRGNTTIRRSTISDNVSTAGAGGGIVIDAPPSITVTLENVTISGNQSVTGGSALSTVGTATITLKNGTVVDNASVGGSDASRAGVSLNSSTSLVVDNSIIAGNTNDGGVRNCRISGTLTSNGNNLANDATCGLTAAGDVQNTDPKLGPLALYGGTTPTHLPLFGSPAIDTGSADAPGTTAGSCAAKDQRGVTRSFDGDLNSVARCDKGAVEARVVQVDRSDDPDPMLSSANACTAAAGDCSLRGAVQNANSLTNRTGDVIRVPAVHSPYTVNRSPANEDANLGGDLDITAGMEIAGEGALTTIIQAGTTDSNGIDRIVDVRDGGSLAMSGVTLRFGRPLLFGGALLIHPLGSAALSDIALSQNRAGDSGGAILSEGTLTLKRSTVSGNTVTTSAGGNNGGAIKLFTGSTALQNVTVSGNTAASGLSASGISISAFTSVPISFENLTVTGNSGATALVMLGTAGPVIRNSIVANNTSSSNCSSGFVSGGGNLSSDGTCGFTASGDALNTNPLLGPLQNNGGPTLTHLPAFGSPAIDTGNNATCAKTDQRGNARPVDGNYASGAVCDKGAVEAGAAPPVTVTVSPAGANNLNVSLGAGACGPISRVRGLPATSSANIRLDIGGSAGGTNLASSFDTTFAPGLTTVPLTLHRSNNLGSGTLAFIVTNPCGDWTTLAGGGASVWGTGSGPEGPGAPASVPTAIPTPAAGPPVPGAACASFATHALAQAYLRRDPTDPLLLDRNRNGIACEGADGAGFVNAPLDQVPVPRP